MFLVSKGMRTYTLNHTIHSLQIAVKILRNTLKQLYVHFQRSKDG